MGETRLRFKAAPGTLIYGIAGYANGRISGTYVDFRNPATMEPTVRTAVAFGLGPGSNSRSAKCLRRLNIGKRPIPSPTSILTLRSASTATKCWSDSVISFEKVRVEELQEANKLARQVVVETNAKLREIACVGDTGNVVRFPSLSDA